MELIWANKDKSLLSKADGGYEWGEPDDPRILPGDGFQLVKTVGEPVGEAPGNLLINGSCLIALRTLAEVSPYKEAYAGKVKLIYLDPPFNAGSMKTAPPEVKTPMVAVLRDAFRYQGRIAWTAAREPAA